MIVLGLFINEALILVADEPIEHLIDELEWEVVFPDGSVELSIVHGNSKASDGAS